MTQNVRRIDIRLLSAILGLALGTGWMTSLRFWGPVGFSEVMFVIFALILFLKLRKGLFSFSKDGFGAIKLYFFLSFIIVAPVVTMIFTVHPSCAIWQNSNSSATLFWPTAQHPKSLM